MNWSSRAVCLLVFTNVLLALSPQEISAQPVPEGPDMPDAISSFFNDLKLGARVEGSVLHWGHSAPPLVNENRRFLKRPVGGDLSFATPLYGISGALRYQEAEVRASYRGNFGLRPHPHLHWQNGEAAIPLRPSIRDLEVQGRYMITSWIGFGARYRNRLVNLRQKMPSRINGESTRSSLFDGNVHRETLSLLVPLSYHWGRTTVFGRVGATVYGSCQAHYSYRFILHDESVTSANQEWLREGNYDSRSDRKVNVNSQFARIGVTHPLLGTTVRFSGFVTRMDVPDVPADWHVGVQLDIGLPF